MHIHQTSLSALNQFPFTHLAMGKTHLHSQYQIDFFPTGKGGAAICLRYGSPGKYRIVVYDGGTPKTGRELIAHIREQYGTNVVDDVVCSHPNADHALGLCDVVEEMDVRCLWMHRPWHYSLLIAGYFLRKYTTTPSQAAHFDEKFGIPYILNELAFERGIPVCEPFQGAQIGPLTVMSPHRDWYIHKLIPEFENPLPALHLLPATLNNVLQLNRDWTAGPSTRLSESWEVETLTEGGLTSAENESSVVLFGKIGGQGILLTGNCGVKALSNTASYADHQRIHIPTHLKFVQIPHHGDGNHVSPSVLDRLIGPKLRAGAVKQELTAMIFTPHREKGYPNKLVVNALIRRGARVARAVNGKDQSIYRFEGEDFRPIDAIRLSVEE